MGQNILQDIPNTNFFINSLISDCCNKDVLKYVIEKRLNLLRDDILAQKVKEIDVESIKNDIQNEYKDTISGTLKPVINATGVVLHTNLGRAVISSDIFSNLKDIVTSYTNLEYDLKKGERGDRYYHLRDYLKILTNAEDAVIVNNNAAAVFLILNTFAKKKDVIVSRGELIEIGGSFRIPEVMKNSGAKLKEVGTTNKTKLSDYEDGIDEKTAIVMKVHKSNYQIVGFTEDVHYAEIPKLLKKYKKISYFDLGSGVIDNILNDKCNEPTISQVIKSGYDLVSASGDKLIGGVQCGIIVGKSEYIKKIKKNQLLRMLRVDKLTLAFLQETLKCYIKKEYDKIKTIELLTQDRQSLLKKANTLREYLLDENVEIVDTKTLIGGGSCPVNNVASVGIKIYVKDENKIERKIRGYKKPVIVRKGKGFLLFDMLTIFEDDLETLAKAIKWAKT
jgi:L-seryl-tRNA(Ser) seleniumtransferase